MKQTHTKKTMITVLRVFFANTSAILTEKTFPSYILLRKKLI